MHDWRALACLVSALRPWLDELVIVGGWAHRLYRMMPMVPTLAYQPVRTLDADVAFSATVSLTGDMGTALKAAGFREELAGEHSPPVTWYHLSGDAQGFYAEFMVQKLLIHAQRPPAKRAHDARYAHDTLDL